MTQQQEKVPTIHDNGQHPNANAIRKNMVTVNHDKVKDTLNRAVREVTDIMLTDGDYIPTDADAVAALYTACQLMQTVTATLSDALRDRLPAPGRYGDAIITTTQRQTRSLLAISDIRDAAAEVTDDEAIGQLDDHTDARICRYVIDHHSKDSNESKNENLKIDLYEVTA